MSARRGPLLGALLVGGCLLAAGTARGAAPAVDFVADLVGRTFVGALADGATGELQPLVADRLSFDGEVLAGAAAQRRLAAVARRARAHGRPRRLVLLPYAAARARFGEAPARLRSLGLAGTVIVFARLPRGGLIVIVKRVAGRWKVVGLSD